MKVVLDSNVLLVAIGRRSKYRPIWNSFINGQIQLVLSEEIIHEYEEILKVHAAPGAAELIFEILIESPDVIFKHIYYLWNAITKDPDDNKFFDVAVAGNADYLVTNDAHFNEVKNLSFPKVNIISAEDFLNILLQETNFDPHSLPV
jgi:putative PIN family toxin of toxin-antitoxin system